MRDRMEEKTEREKLILKNDLTRAELAVFRLMGQRMPMNG